MKIIKKRYKDAVKIIAQYQCVFDNLSLKIPYHN